VKAKVARHTFRVSYLVIGILLIIIALLSVTARFGLPLVAGYKDNIEARISQALGSPVLIGELLLSWEGSGPLLRAKWRSCNFSRRYRCIGLVVQRAQGRVARHQADPDRSCQ